MDKEDIGIIDKLTFEKREKINIVQIDLFS
jgi:hypothetical protein